jgi:hypothetical protein
LGINTASAVNFAAKFQFAFLLLRVRAKRRVAGIMSAMRSRQDGSMPSMYVLKELGNGARLHKSSDDRKLKRAENDLQAMKKDLLQEKAAKRQAVRDAERAGARAECAEERAEFTADDLHNAQRRVSREEVAKVESDKKANRERQRQWWLRNHLLPGLREKVALAHYCCTV